MIHDALVEVVVRDALVGSEQDSCSVLCDELKNIRHDIACLLVKNIHKNQLR